MTDNLGERGQQMMLIKSLDPGACLEYSEFTHKWYVSSNIEIAEKGFLTGITEHDPIMAEAVMQFISRLRSVTDYTQALAAKPLGERRYYRWNGVTFAEVPKPDGH